MSYSPDTSITTHWAAPDICAALYLAARTAHAGRTVLDKGEYELYTQKATTDLLSIWPARVVVK
jgi:hypothetical protein